MRLASICCSRTASCPGSTGNGTTFTTTQTNSTVTSTNNVTQRADLFSTELRVQMQGGPVLLDQIFPMAFSSSGVQAAVLSDQAFLAARGALGLLGPTLLSSNTVLTNSVTATSTSSISSLVVEPALTTVGPALLQVGDIGACAGFDTVSDMPFGCNPAAGSQFLVKRGSVNIDVDAHTFVTATVTNTTTNTFTTTQVYNLIGLPTPNVPEPGTLVLAGAGLLWLWRRRA